MDVKPSPFDVMLESTDEDNSGVDHALDSDASKAQKGLKGFRAAPTSLTGKITLITCCHCISHDIKLDRIIASLKERWTLYLWYTRRLICC